MSRTSTTNNLPIEWSSFISRGNEANYILEALASGWVSGGAFIERLERQLESIYSGTEAYAVANGTAALQLAFQVLGVKPGDRVIVPNFCFQAASNVLQQLGAVPVFCDVDALTWNQTVQTVADVHVEGVVGVVVVHNYGRAAPSDRIAKWARSKGLWIIEDCAEAWFTRLGDRYAGLHGDVTTLSMHATKTISSGEGGVVMLNDRRLSERLKLLRSHGLNRGKVHYQHELAGNNYRLSNLLAAVACAQLEQWQGIVADQGARNDIYLSELGSHFGLEIQRPIRGASDLVWAIGVRLNTGLLHTTRDAVIRALRDRGIETRPGFYPASTLSYNNKFVLGQLPVSESIAKEILVLPCAPTLDRAKILYVAECLLAVLDVDGGSARNLEMIDLRSASDVESLIKRFVARLGSGRQSFRYFDKRPPEVVRTHDVSLMSVDRGTPIAYGHIETENGQSWLGIAVTEQARSGGHGKMMMTRLLAGADELELSAVNLKVDAYNVRARRLYESFGFRVDPSLSSGHAVHMVRRR